MAERNEFQADWFLDIFGKKAESIVADFKQKMESREIFKAMFSAADTDGNMFYMFREDGSEYEVLLPAEELAGEKNKKNARRMASLSKQYPVVVKEVDEESHRITVSYQMARDAARAELVESILTELSGGQPVRSKARVAFIRTSRKNNNSFLELDIGGVGVTGYLFREDWSTCYTSDLSGFAAVGDIIDVEVIGVLSPKQYKAGTELANGDRNAIFRCSRKNTLDHDPWEGVDRRYPAGTIVNIVCVDKHIDKFFAKIEGVKDINVLGLYPDNADFTIREGGRYQAVVKKVNEAEKVLTLRPYKEL